MFLFPRSSPLKRIALFLALFLTLAACGGGGATVASVNGFDIGLDDVEALAPNTGGAIPTDQFIALLSNLIIHRAVVDYSESELSITASDEAIQQRIDELTLQFGGTDEGVEERLAEQNATLELVRVVAWQQVVQEQLMEVFQAEASPSEEELQTLYDQNQQSLSNVCASHILFLTEAAPDASEDEIERIDVAALTNAEAALERAEEGEDFASLAMELSEGPSAPDGGDLGCSAPSAYVPEFANATLQADIGEPFGPVKTQFGYHVILVSERDVPELADVEEQLVAQFAATSAQEDLRAFLIEAINVADVTVDEEYGAWVEGQPGQPSQLLPPPS